MKNFYISKHDNLDQKLRVIENINKTLAESDFDIEIRIIKSKSLRTAKQNNSLHKLFELIANELNDQGQDFEKVFTDPIHLQITPEIVKEFIWRRIQIEMFGIESTTKLTTEQINKVYDVINKFLSERFGIYVPFPNKEEMK